jgi:putative sterol carrier protein
MDIEAIFEDMKIKVLAMKPIKSTIKFIVENYIFVIDGRGPKNIVYQNQDIPDVASTVITDRQTFFRMKRGELSPMTGLMTAKIDIEGSLGLAFRLKHLLTS